MDCYKYYAVKVGDPKGIYLTWTNGAELATNNKKNKFKSFSVFKDALSYMNDGPVLKKKSKGSKSGR